MAERIGIFKGRSALYNKLILKVLTEAFSEGKRLKEWELAKRIQKKLDKGENWYIEAQRIYSVLIRKNGRLRDLENKWYVQCEIKEEDGRKVRYWFPTPKGLIATLILDSNLIDDVANSPFWESKEFKKGLAKEVKKYKKTTRKGHVPVKVSPKSLKKLASQFVESFKDKEKLRNLMKDVKYLIDKGFQLDLMGETDFPLMIQLTPTIKEMQKKLAVNFMNK
ncbi:hypothetical protein DRO54_07385 [Candidatus Bathyarchaeota archaeon]|nr:MAG: hypothetical protein DRO54_07385 [Candidatus Bathyarchaeota archaeon]